MAPRSGTLPAVYRRFNPALLCVGAALCLISAPGAAVAQLTWEYSPYEVRAWVAMEDSSEYSPRLRRDIAATLQSGARGAAGYAWRLSIEEAPESVGAMLLEQSDPPAAESLRGTDAEVLRGDKLLTVAVRPAAAGHLVTVRELDVATRQWSDPLELSTRQVDAIPQLALFGAVRSIRPIAKVERVDGKTITARLRAGGLIVEPDSPALVEPGRALQPIIRRNGKDGEPSPAGGIHAPLWSFIAVEERNGSALVGTLHSGYGNIIPAKGGPRTERLALAVARQHAVTRLELRARVAPSPGGAGQGRPLSGYEVFVKFPGDGATELVGLTDLDGALELEAIDGRLRLFYVRNGGQLLARLPLVVGHQQVATANVIDDDPRLQVEAYVKALQSRVLDLVARREILAVRIRAKLKKGDVSGARQLVEEFRSLPSREQLVKELEDAERRAGPPSGLTGRRISQLFLNGKQLLTEKKFLDPETVEQLAREVREAESKGPPATTAATTETS